MKMNDSNFIQISDSFKIDQLSFNDFEKTIDNINEYMTYSQNVQDGVYKFKIMSHINVNCSYQELANIFNISDDIHRNTTMKELYKEKFINGRILHHIPDNHILIKKDSYKFSFILPNKECCYIEHFIQDNSTIKITITSIDKNKYTKEKESNDNKIDNILAEYNIKIVDTDQNLHNDNVIFNINFNGVVLNTNLKNYDISKKYVSMLARGLKDIPDIITNRRLLFQQPANLSLCNIYNKHCINCSKKISIFSKKRCYICSYTICSKCIIKQKLYKNDKYITVHICKKCIDCINKCDYSNVTPYIDMYQKIVEDTEDYNAGENVANFLKNRFDNDEDIYLEDFDKYLAERPILDECVLTNDSERPYPIKISKDYIAPIPDNEEQRLEAVHNIEVMDLFSNKELNIICESVNIELRNDLTMITIIDEEQVYAIACNNKNAIGIYPRDESICQHLLMSNVPLLINNPISDVRYYNLPAVTGGLKFYFSVPIYSSDNYIIGSFCSLNNKEVKQVTASQYEVMNKLSKTVAKIIEQKKI